MLPANGQAQLACAGLHTCSSNRSDHAHLASARRTACSHPPAQLLWCLRRAVCRSKQCSETLSTQRLIWIVYCCGSHHLRSHMLRECGLRIPCTFDRSSQAGASDACMAQRQIQGSNCQNETPHYRSIRVTMHALAACAALACREVRHMSLGVRHHGICCCDGRQCGG